MEPLNRTNQLAQQQQIDAARAKAEARARAQRALREAGISNTQDAVVLSPEQKLKKLKLLQAQAQSNAANQGRAVQGDVSKKELQRMIDELSPTQERLPKEEMDRMIAELDGSSPSNGRTFGDAVMDNIVGRDDGVMSYGEKLGTFLNKAGESLTFGLVGDEASAAVESLVPGVNYSQRRDHYRQQERQFAEQHPVASLGAELVPLAIPATGLANAAVRSGNIGHAMLKGSALAGAQGATYGFMEGEDGFQNRLQEAKEAGAVSAGIGAVAAPLTRAAQRNADHRATQKAVGQMVKEAPSVDDLTAQATSLYGRGEARGQILSPEAAKGLADDVQKALREQGVMRSNGQLITRDQDVRRVVQELQDLAEFGLEGNQVKPVRSLFQAAASDRDPMRARIGKILLSKFDDTVKRHAPEFAEGDALYHRAKKAQAVDQMIDLADTSDTANALRREFGKVDRKNIKGQLHGMTPDEVAAMQRVARGSRGEAIARTMGRSAPRSVSGALFTGSTPLIAGSLAGSPAIGATVGATALGAGMAGRAMSNRTQRANAMLAKALIARGGQMPKAQAAYWQRETIARILMGLGPRIGAGVAAGP